jgi:hypothetical protein
MARFGEERRMVVARSPVVDVIFPTWYLLAHRFYDHMLMVYMTTNVSDLFESDSS